MSNLTAMVQTPWNYCKILRNDGLPFRLRDSTEGRVFLDLSHAWSCKAFCQTLRLLLHPDIKADPEAAPEQFATNSEDFRR